MEKTEKPSQSPQSILVVDDNSEIVFLICEFLRREKFLGIAATGSAMARSLWKEHRETIWLVITDLQMPETDGDELVREFLKDKPDLKVIFTSGTPSVADEFLKPNINFFSKPFRFDDVMKRVREMEKG